MKTKPSNSIQFILYIVFASICITSCSSDETMEPEDNMPPMEENETCNDVSSSYSDDIRPIINLSCAVSGCHEPGGQGTGDFESYDGIKEKADNGSLLNRVVTIGNMPPSNSTAPVPNEEQRNLIKCWIESGAPMN